MKILIILCMTTLKQKEKFLKNKPHCNIGTIGHVDHGKTTLTAAITKVLSFLAETNTKYVRYSDIDKHTEERRRGITISASHIEYETKNRHYTHIDCPGHQNYIKNMITGATQMDGVILVVSLVDGPQEQTREHVILAMEVGIPHMIIYGNKLDSVLEVESLEYTEFLTRELVSTYGYPEDLPFIKGSAKKALQEEQYADFTELGSRSIVELMNVVDEYIKQPVRLENAPFLMSIEEIYSISGRGTVVTGRVETGKLTIGTEVEIVGSKIFKTICTGLEMYNKSLDLAIAGESIGVLIRGISKNEIKRGYVLSMPGVIVPSIFFLGKAYFLTFEEGGRKKPILNGFTPQFFFRTANMTGTFILSPDIYIKPGDTLEFIVKLIDKAPISKGLRFVMREGSKTLGAGIILEVSNDLDRLT